MKRVLRYTLPAVALLALTALLLWFRGDIGIPRSRIAADVRADLPAGALLQAEYGEKLAAVLVETEGEPALRVYVNRPGLSFGWFFRYGGSAPAGRAVCFTGAGERLCAAGYGHGIVSVEIGGENPLPVPEGPFVLVLPANRSAVFYDAAGAPAEVLSRTL